jgi:hypothetical protein
MTNWISLLKSDPLPWLLEEDNPSVRYFALIDIQGVPSQDRRVIAAKKAIMAKGTVPKILAKQSEGGFWEKAEDFYIRVNIEKKGEPSKWVTLLALKALKKYFS